MICCTWFNPDLGHTSSGEETASEKKKNHVEPTRIHTKAIIISNLLTEIAFNWYACGLALTGRTMGRRAIDDAFFSFTFFRIFTRGSKRFFMVVVGWARCNSRVNCHTVVTGLFIDFGIVWLNILIRLWHFSYRLVWFIDVLFFPFLFRV